MSYQIGAVEMQGSEPSNVIHAVFARKTTDGGKARIKARRHLLFNPEAACDFSMVCADTGDCA